jgi:N-acetyl-gamma-glutamyl-phosphate reductase
MAKKRVVIVGATGYSGAELCSLLLRHSGAEIVGLFGSSRREEKTVTMGELHPRLRGVADLPVGAAEIGAIAALKPDAVFLCTPHEASVELAPELLHSLGESAVVFDLSGGFRLKAEHYPRYYGFEHAALGLLEKAVYGLAEVNRAKIASPKVRLVAVPGCYPTSAILPLRPLAAAGAMERGRRPIVDSTSGVSGAGRTPTAKVHFCEVSLQPYNVLKHRHNPEIDLHSGTGVVFTPHLGAFDRGILSTIHVDLAESWNGARVGETLRAAYSGETFVRLLGADVWPSVAGVRGTNFCDIGWACDDANRHLIVVSAIDNLVKGAAGQALQCMNIRFGLPETEGLL